MESQGVYNIALLVCTVIGGIFAFFQWRRDITMKRAKFIQQIIEELRSGKELSSIMYLLDYNPLWYDHNFHTSSIEPDVDRLLSCLNYICYMKSTNVISKKEFEALKYHVHRALVSPSSKTYLWNIFHFAKSNNTPCAFSYLIDYGIASALLPAEFKTDKTLYTKVLNFN